MSRLKYKPFRTQISTSVLGEMHVMIMQTVLIVMVVTGVSVCQDSREMDTTVQVSFLQKTVVHNIITVVLNRY